VLLADDFGGRLPFPSDNWWNVDISNAPVDPQSSAYIDFIGRTRTSHPDFGPPPYGIPYVGVSSTQALVPVTFVAYGSESDNGFGGQPGYPIPPIAATQAGYIEGGAPGGGSSGDRHLLIVDRDRWRLFELFAAHWNGGAQRWEPIPARCSISPRMRVAPTDGRPPTQQGSRFFQGWFVTTKQCVVRSATPCA
jgi:hypothetical protein